MSQDKAQMKVQWHLLTIYYYETMCPIKATPCGNVWPLFRISSEAMNYMHTSQTAHGVCDLCMRAGKTRIMWLHGTVRVAVLHTITQICPLKVTHYIYGLRLGLHEGINASVAFLCGANEWRQLRLVTRLKFVIESHTVSVVLLLFFLFAKLAHVKHDTAGLFMHLIFVYFFIVVKLALVINLCIMLILFYLKIYPCIHNKYGYG